MASTHTGLVSNIQKYSLNDGAGIRSTIFLQGCPLRCQWCANPETWQLSDDIATGDDHFKPRRMHVSEVVNTVKKDFIYIRQSGGGVTYSGGEPTMQADFLRGLVQAFEFYGLHQAIETCGYFNWSQLQDIFAQLDLIFFDVKLFNAQAHRQFTEVDNALILDNLAHIGKLNTEVVVRVPVIKGVNATAEMLFEITDYVKSVVKSPKIELLPYHPYGEYKYQKIGQTAHLNKFSAPDDAWISDIEAQIASRGVTVVHYK